MPNCCTHQLQQRHFTMKQHSTCLYIHTNKYEKHLDYLVVATKMTHLLNLRESPMCPSVSLRVSNSLKMFHDHDPTWFFYLTIFCFEQNITRYLMPTGCKQYFSCFILYFLPQFYIFCILCRLNILTHDNANYVIYIIIHETT